LGLRDRVMMLPWVDRVAPLLKRASAVAISSHSECCPMLVFEAMAARKPLVATRVGGIPALVEHGESALLVEPDQPEALAGALVEVLSNPAHAARLGMAGRARLEAEFTTALTARRLAMAYNASATDGRH